MKREGIKLENIKWSQPLTLEKCCEMFGLKYTRRNTMSRWLRSQAIRNRKISRCHWRIHIEDLPAEYMARVLFEKLQEKRGQNDV